MPALKGNKNMSPANPFRLPEAEMRPSKAPISKKIELIVSEWSFKKYALLATTEIQAIVTARSPNQEKPSLSEDVIRSVEPN